MEEAVVLCLRAWFASRVPRPAKTVDIRKISDPKWVPLVVYFGTAKRLAAFLDVSEMTIGRWTKGMAPEKFHELQLKALSLTCGVPSPV